MDPLSITAGITGLIAIADTVVRQGFKILKNIRDIDESVRRLVEEVNSLSGILYSLRNVIELLEDGSLDTHPSTEIDHISSCQHTLMRINEAFRKMVGAEPPGKFRKLLWPFNSSETKELLLDIERHKRTIALAMGVQDMTALRKLLAGHDILQQNLQDIKTGIEQLREGRESITLNEERHKWLNWLCEVDTRKSHDFHIGCRQPGTGLWFINSPEFQFWLSSEGSKLWVTGIPGAGKTVLISAAIEEAQTIVDRSDDAGLAFFYCDYRDKETHDPLNILGSLGRQLAVQNEACFIALRDFYQIHTAGNRSTRKFTSQDICGLIIRLALNFESVMIIVDGLDEISQNRSEITCLLGSLNTSSKAIKILFASRDEVDLKSELEDFVHVCVSARAEDLQLYITSEIEERIRQRHLRFRDWNLKDYTIKTLIDHSDGMFLWVVCQIDYLCTCTTDRNRRKALFQLPPGLATSYERIFERLNRGSQQTRTLVRDVLHWIIYSTTPITIEKLLQALNVRDEDSYFESDQMAMEEDLLYWCSSLVRTDPISNHIQPVHFTVKEFLISIDPLATPDLAQYRLSDDHTILAKSCLNFLSCTTFDSAFPPCPPATHPTADNGDYKDWVDFLRKYPFFEYASLYWNVHVHHSEWANVGKAVRRFINPESSSIYQLWTSSRIYFESVIDYNELDVRINSKPSALHWAACFALDKVCYELIQSGMDVNDFSSFGTPLRCAMLSERALHQDHGLRSKYMKQWLYFETERGSIISALLRAGADYNMAAHPDGKVTAIQLAQSIDTSLGKPFMESIFRAEGVNWASNPAALDVNMISDTSSDAESVLSAMTATTSSKTSISSEIGLIATGEFVKLLLEDTLLKSLCLEAIMIDRMGDQRFERNFRRLLKQYSVDLKAEAETRDQKAAVSFVHSRSRYIANQVRMNVSPGGGSKPHAWLETQSKSETNKLSAVERYLVATDFTSFSASVGSAVENLSHLPKTSLLKAQQRPLDDESDFESEGKNILDNEASEFHDEQLPRLSDVKNFMFSSTAFSTFRENLEHLIHPSSASALRRMLRKLSNSDSVSLLTGYSLQRLKSLVVQLSYIPPNQILILKSDGIQLSDRLKITLENLTGDTWNWWPLRQPKKILSSGHLRVQWQCSCGETLWEDVPSHIGKRIAAIMQQFMSSPTSRNMNDSEDSQTRGSSSTSHRAQDQSDNPTQNSGPPEFEPSAKMYYESTANILASQDLSDSVAFPSNPVQATTYVILGVVRGDDLRLAQIEVQGHKDIYFFRQLRIEYNTLRGFLRRWLSIWRYNHCNFIKFEKIGDGETVPRGSSVPDPGNTQYLYNPKPIEHDPPVSTHEFYRRFYSCYGRCLASKFSMLRYIHKCRRPCRHSREVLDRIPKKTWRVEEEGSERQFFWGILAVEKLSFFMVFIYHALVLFPPLLFWALWMFSWGHMGDLQNASVPFLAALGLISLFWFPLFSR